jgi:DNA-3-methyladenine glycosylase II
LKSFTTSSFKKARKALAARHSSIHTIIETYGIPPMFQRPFGFETLVQIILEQQVSLASGRAVFKRLQNRLGSITPHGLLQLTKDELRTCSVSRQKAGYLHHLSQTVHEGNLILEALDKESDDEVRKQLMQVKGIGPWTADVVLMLCMQRYDVLPLGDIALINSIKHIHNQPDWTVADIQFYTEGYKPYRTIAAYCYWHAYIQRKNITVSV